MSYCVTLFLMFNAGLPSATTIVLPMHTEQIASNAIVQIEKSYKRKFYKMGEESPYRLGAIDRYMIVNLCGGN